MRLMGEGSDCGRHPGPSPASPWRSRCSTKAKGQQWPGMPCGTAVAGAAACPAGARCLFPGAGRGRVGGGGAPPTQPWRVLLPPPSCTGYETAREVRAALVASGERRPPERKVGAGRPFSLRPRGSWAEPALERARYAEGRRRGVGAIWGCLRGAMFNRGRYP